MCMGYKTSRRRGAMVASPRDAPQPPYATVPLELSYSLVRRIYVCSCRSCSLVRAVWRLSLFNLSMYCTDSWLVLIFQAYISAATEHQTSKLKGAQSA